MFIVSNTALTDISNHVRQFYSRFNNVLSVIGKGSREMCTLHLNKLQTYFLRILVGKCETTAILHCNITDFIFYRPKKTAVLEKIGHT